MSWIELPRQQRCREVQDLINYIKEVNFDRFWFSADQDGPDTQIMHILLPAQIGEDVYYNITMQTAQSYAASAAAQQLGQVPGQKLCIDNRLLEMLDNTQEEIFCLDPLNDKGIGLFIVLDVTGLTHKIIDRVLGDFRDGGYAPLPVNKINPNTLVERMLKFREEKKHHLFPI
ncbi:hypothetical protein ACYPKM_05485 [Pseudomonas aeruginosa]